MPAQEEPENSPRNIFNEAVKLTDATERAAFLQRACGDDNALCRKFKTAKKTIP